MKRLVILILMIILMGCGSKEKAGTDIKTLTEGEKQALLLINRVTTKNPNIITIKDGLIVDSLIVELYGKGALKDGTKENLELIGLARLLEAGGKIEDDKFDEAFKKEIKLAKSLKIPQLHTYIEDDYLVSEYENIKIKRIVFKDENNNLQLTDNVEYYYNNNLVTITKEQEELGLEFLKYNLNINKYIEENQKKIFLYENENGNTLALKKEEFIKGNIAKQIIYNHLGGIFIEFEEKDNTLFKIKIYNLSKETIGEFEKKGEKPCFKFFKDGYKIIEFEEDDVIRSFDKKGNIKGTIDLVTGVFEERDGNYKFQGKADEQIFINLNLMKLLKIKNLKDVYIHLITGIKTISKYENDILIKNGIWIWEEKYGEHKEWYSNGKLKSIKEYHRDKLIGESKEYYETGEIKERVEYSSNDINYYASVNKYYKNGNLEETYSCLLKNNKRIYDGYITKYYKNNVIKLKGRYETIPPKFDKAFKTGIWRYYDSNGNYIKEESYKNGELKTEREYRNDKIIRNIQVLNNGNKYVEEYNKTGSYIEKEYYLNKNNDFIWEYKEYGYANYSRYLKLEGRYVEGLKEGEWKHYNKDRKIMDIVIYVNGKDVNDIADKIEKQEKWNIPRVEYYPSGRVKSYSDGPFEAIYEDKDINFIELENFVKNIEKEVEEYIKTKDEEMGYSISISLNEGMGSNIPIYSLNKNLTSEEKKKLQELQVRIEKCHEKASQIWGAQ